MKAEIKTKEKYFEPIELNITIESRFELISLIRALATDDNDRNEDLGLESYIEKSNGCVNFALWEKIGSPLEKMANNK